MALYLVSFSPLGERRIRERDFRKLLGGSKVANEILREHGLKAWSSYQLDAPLVLKEVPFKGGRADLLIFGLRENIYVIPIAIEVKAKANTYRELLEYIAQIKRSYDNAFNYIYLAVGKLKISVEKLFHGIGYGLITLEGNKAKILVKASPKKTPNDLSSYYEMASLGTLFMATKEALVMEGYSNLEEGRSGWIGVGPKISICSYIHGGYAVLGIYALNISNTKKLAEFLVEHKELIKVLIERGYRVYIETYPAYGGIRGYIRILDDLPSIKLFVNIKDKVEKLKLEKRWGLGLGIYKNLWWVNNPPPTYLTALRTIREELKELSIFKELILSS